MKRTILLVCSILFSAVACVPLTPEVSNNNPSTFFGNSTPDHNWIEVYFSEPGGPLSSSQRGGPDAALAEAILEAQASVDLAIYDLNLWSIRDALLQVHRRGVVVRVVTESDNFWQDEIQDLIEAGIPVLADRHEPLMHNKFVVIDRYQVWTGSMNLTLNGAYHNNNNLLRLNSSKLAENYLVEFEEMFIEDLFGNESPANLPNPVISINGIQIETFFSPDDHPLLRIVELIDQAQEEIMLMAFNLTADPIRDALLAAQARGVQLRGVLEKGQINNIGGDFETLRAAGLELYMDGNPRYMHHKVIIIDQRIVITGSYNFSNSAEYHNDENVLILHDPQTAELFLVEFDKLLANAQ